ncbi:MAG TPA: hypothetical protein VK615_03080 [Candidatus Binatia bacterium]|nr:hypothetical protein [Candidatus Binatia bacterium]
MKLHSNPYKLFFLAVMFATIAVGAFVGGIEGHKWTHAYKPFAQFFVGVISICLGPSLIATALNARASEDALTVWKRHGLRPLPGAFWPRWAAWLCYGSFL